MPNWNEVFQEMKDLQDVHNREAAQCIDSVRRRYLNQLSTATKRSTIAYYSAFAQKGDISGSGVNDDDKNGFMMAIHQLDRSHGLDLFIHTLSNTSTYKIIENQDGVSYVKHAR